MDVSLAVFNAPCGDDGWDAGDVCRMLINAAGIADRHKLGHVHRVLSAQAEMIERDVLERFSKGLVQKNVEIGTNEDLNRIMLARSLAGRQT